jgi:pimeloyl-ACP methyl ester carboxylesterase
VLNSRPGVYFLEPYDKQKIPVLFVHGISGSPAQFDYLIEHLDRSRFQPWVYSYTSGMYLSTIADHLNQTMLKLELRYQVDRIVVVGHSMGGLVARGFLLRQANSSSVRTPLLITLSTPWAGHAAAAAGVKHALAVVDVWRDMAPDSEYLRDIFAKPLSNTDVHLMFTFARNSTSFGASDDHTVTVASQLYPLAQRESVRLYGFDETHTGVLRNKEAAKLMNELLNSLR